MGTWKAQGAPHHLLLYDGEFGFCTRAVQFVLARDRRRVFHFAALKGAAAHHALGPFGGVPADLTTFHVIEDYRGVRPALHSRSGAALLVARALGPPWSLATALRVLPRPWLDAAYAVVARHRHRILGRTEACTVPHSNDRDRFLDTDGVSP